MRLNITHLTVLLGLLTVTRQPADAQARSDWRVVREHEGITVSVDESQESMPTFRSEGEVQGNVLHVLSVVLDGSRAHEWSDEADENAVLRVIDDRSQIVYTRSHQPWPVRDRDLVMHRKVEVIEPGRAFLVHLVCVPGEKPPRPGTIRIVRCDTQFWLRAVGPATTRVTYQVRVDPGGTSPGWLVRAASENGPLHTLLGLRAQVARTRGQYSKDMRAWADAR